jgi:uncharacterized RDD family membrane protein YckC
LTEKGRFSHEEGSLGFLSFFVALQELIYTFFGKRRMNTIIIPTTQNIELEYPIANLGDRILAFLLDALVMLSYFLLWWAISELFDVQLRSDFGSEYEQTVYILVALPAIFYHLFSEIFLDGQSLGKMALNIRVIKLDGTPPSLSDYLLRWAFRLLDITAGIVFPGVVAVVAIAVTPKGQRLGDLAAHTTLVKLKLVTHFGDTIFMDTEEDYAVQFPEIRLLSDRDVSILKEVLDAGLRSNNPELLRKLSEKVKEVAGIESTLEAREFLETILRDYNHTYGRENPAS